MKAMRGFGLLFLVGCSTAASHPCQEAGEPARDGKWPGTRQCVQSYDKASGRHLNDGRYIDWYPNGKRALVGEYKMGKKHGSWTSYDENGKKLWEKWYIEGKEVSRIEVESVPGYKPAPVELPPAVMTPEGLKRQ